MIKVYLYSLCKWLNGSFSVISISSPNRRKDISVNDFWHFESPIELDSRQGDSIVNVVHGNLVDYLGNYSGS